MDQRRASYQSFTPISLCSGKRRMHVDEHWSFPKYSFVLLLGTNLIDTIMLLNHVGFRGLSGYLRWNISLSFFFFFFFTPSQHVTIVHELFCCIQMKHVSLLCVYLMCWFLLLLRREREAKKNRIRETLHLKKRNLVASGRGSLRIHYYCNTASTEIVPLYVRCFAWTMSVMKLVVGPKSSQCYSLYRLQHLVPTSHLLTSWLKLLWKATVVHQVTTRGPFTREKQNLISTLSSWTNYVCEHAVTQKIHYCHFKF